MVEHIHRVGGEAGGEQMEVGLAFEAEFLPRLAAVVAADQAERIDQTRARRRVAAAVEALTGGGEAHVVVLGAGRLGPFPLLVDREAVVARNVETRPVGAPGEAMDVG